MLLKIKMVHFAGKKHSVRYKAVSGSVQPAITTVYLMRTAFEGKPPPELLVSVEWPEEGDNG